ncbi:MAG: hypothetical protein SXQ77_09340, partial [Halobacteria archaeon]|nr:hypothetical protein [Halobacteria archaeon]
PEVNLTPSRAQTQGSHDVEVRVEVSSPLESERISVSRNERKLVELADRHVKVGGDNGSRDGDRDDDNDNANANGNGNTTLHPELVVRYPGTRTLYYPGSDYYLFPSFGLNLEDVPNPLEVPMHLGSP